MSIFETEEERVYHMLTDGSQEDANQVLLEKISAHLAQPGLSPNDTIRLIQEYRAIRHERGAGDGEDSPLAQVMQIFQGDDE